MSLLLAGACTLLVALLGPVARGDAARNSVRYRLFGDTYRAWADTDSVAADTDSVAVTLPPALLRALADTLAADSLRARFSTLSPDSLRALLDSLGSDTLLTLLDSLGLDSLYAAADSLNADTLAAPDTAWRVQRYLAPFYRRDSRAASLLPRRNRPLAPGLSNLLEHNLVLDSTGTDYLARERVGDADVRYPVRVTREQYRREKLSTSLDRNWREIGEQLALQRQQLRRGGLGLNVVVPGGRQSAFTTIFGKNEVDLRVTGNADIRTGFDYRKSDQQVTLGTGTQIDPDFKQDLRLGVVGTIGDKMQVDVNWDTNSDFDFQNQLRLQYTGYEDEILQSVEAGNVFLQTPSSLIRGGQSLFGIKTEWQLGDARITTVVSQQEGQSNNLSLEGGAETTEFSIGPTEYEERQHFFLSYYFRNRWEDALADPPTVLIDGQFERIIDIEVWKLQRVSPEEQNIRQVVAMVDLGESPEILRQADTFTREELPNPGIDQYEDFEIEQVLRPGTNNPQTFLEENTEMPLTSSDYQLGQFKKLERGRDYDIDEVLGYISLRQRLQEQEALAVSFKYLANGNTVQVGDFSSQTGGGDNSQVGNRLVLKLIRPVNLKQPTNLGQPNEQDPAAWYLELRNIYRLGRGLNQNDFQLNITYEPPGKSPSRTISGVTGQRTLIQVLGLDQLNTDGARRPDDKFDFLVNFNILPSDGLLIFPYLEPFGNRIAEVIDESGNSPEDKAALKEALVFDDLYTLKKENAQRNTQLDVYNIEGSYSGSIQSFYDLRAFSGLVPGSVRVTSGGTTLTEGVDYTVDYQGGTVTIENPSYLTAGRDIEIDYEQNALINLQKKTLLGARIQYGDEQEGDKLVLGSTIFRMSQKSITDKFRIGEEPIANTIWGIDGRLNLEPRWLTRAIDALPLLQTRELSTIRINGEFAQLRPGHTQTNAFQETRRELTRNGRDFNQDELEGISYMDDFESFENTVPLNRPQSWLLATAPTITDELGIETDLTPSQRSVFGWYQLNPSTLELMGVPPNDPVVGNVSPQQVFPNRPPSSQERTLATLDMYFTPHQRGPYNYNTDLGAFLDEPTRAWGGMTQRLSEGFTDFTSKNIEFIEFIFQPFPEAGSGDRDARLYIDLGQISEDVIPDAKLNTEDGLSITEPGNTNSSYFNEDGLLLGARLSTGQQDQVINPIPSGERITEDLGIDGLASFPGNAFEGTRAAEQVFFEEFLQSLGTTTSTRYPEQLQREIAKAQYDPSGDDYHYFLDATFFENSQFFPGGAASVQQRFGHFFPGLELNSFEAQQKLAPAAEKGNARLPDTEDINLNSTLDIENSYFQYDLPVSLDSLDYLADPSRTDDYVVEEIRRNDGSGTGWYLVRIPVKDYNRQIGGIQDFSRIDAVRVWTTGHSAPITMRFASLELVGSQWRKSEAVNREMPGQIGGPLPPPVDEPVPAPFDEARISIESVNNEENTNYAIPRGTVVNQIRETTGGRRDAREQSMVLHVENLRPGQQQAIFNTYTQGENLLKYGHLRMFTHLHGQMRGGVELQEEDRGKVRIFVRLGANETNDYYEYEMPLTPSPVNPAYVSDDLLRDPDYLWRTNQTFGGEAGVDLNSMNILLGALNQLKFLRDERSAGNPTIADSIFWNDENNVLEEAVAAFAPPGTRIGIRGTPSLNRINTIVLGVRNTTDDIELEDVYVWVNELRTTGYDEDTGYSALVNADIRLADFGTVKANFRTQTDGFGDLASTLDDRRQINARDWLVNTQFNLDKFIPERYGWAIPVTVEVKANTSTPRYDPNRGDVRVSELVEAIENSEGLTPEEQALRREAIIEQAQTYSFTRSFNGRLQKTGSRSRLLRNTLDVTSLTYSWSDNQGRTPNQALQNSWQWNALFRYQLSVRQPKTFRLLGFLDGLPLLDAISGLRFNYLPSTLGFTTNGTRRYSETKERPSPLRIDTDLPQDVQFPLRPQHNFTHNRQFNFQYNPFNFLNLSFDTNTDQSLNALGVDTLFTLIQYQLDEDGEVVRDENGNPVELSRASSSNDLLREALLSGAIDSVQIGESAFQTQQLDVLGFGEVLGDAVNGKRINGQPGLRPEQYSSRASATFRPRLDKVGFLDWMTLQDMGYSSTFTWRNGSVGNNTGASAGVSIDLRAGLTLRPQELFQKFGFYRSLEEAQKAAEQRAQQERQAREQRRTERRKEREARREAERLRREENRRREEAGLPPLEEEGEEGIDPETEEGLPEGEQPEEEGEEMEEGEEEEVEAARPQKMIDGRPVEEAPENQGRAVAEADTSEAGGGSFLGRLLPNPVGVMRQLVLGVTGIQDFTINYNGNRRTDASNVGVQNGNNVDVSYSLLNAIFRDKGPSLGYRFGFDRIIDPNSGNRVISDRLQVTDALTNSDRWQARTTLNPTRNLRVSLSWNLEETGRENITYRRLSPTDVAQTLTENGTNKASVWAFGASYLDLITSQLETFHADASLALADTIRDTNGDGRVALTNESVFEDFFASYMQGGALGNDGRLPFPLPGWQVNYSGISNWPLIRRLTQSATLRHTYSATYDTDFRTNLVSDSLGIFPISSGLSIEYEVPDIEVGGVRINESFQPLIGVDLGFKGGIQTNIAYNTGNTYSLSTTNNVVTETKTSELTLTASWQKQGLTLPFFRSRLNNRVTFSLTLSRKVDDDRTFNVRRVIEAAAEDPAFDPLLALEDPFVSVLTTTARLQVLPKISYQFSNRVSADAFMEYIRFEGDSRRPSTTQVKGGFNIRVSITS